ncbi:Phosphatidate cytidylyltransferase [Meloidogyne graminicola]|uniref:Phosphatidate cytidylyltransferase n=1 Tax=Meloidogyne graminicola TaxID=189291 RepID=A0A8T0A4J7_9BILA|nr:Phosphatidate cytidylyltransferase [Meloidogyne graminicola]
MSQEFNDEEDTLRKRNVLQDSITDTTTQTTPAPKHKKVKRTCGAISSSATSASSDDEDPLNVIKEKRLNKLKRMLPQSSDKLGIYVDKLLSHLPERWRNWVVRGILSAVYLKLLLVMIGIFYFIVKRGVTCLMALVFLLQIKCFSEIINIGLAVYRLYDLPWFRALSWYFLLTSDYFFFGESLIDYWGLVLRKDRFLFALIVHHRLISFVLYCFGFIWFVLSLQKGFYLRQFSLFAWTHVTLLIIVSQSFLIIQNLFQGMIWFLFPVSMIICCDIMSYMFGFFFGKTPLIKLSPKKTWEGFIGGAISTILFGLVLSYFMMENPIFVCPVESYFQDNLNCTIPHSFQSREFQAPKPLNFVFKIFREKPIIRFKPFLFHSVVMALFASLIGPFGGFFASGFKRAFKIKDFGDIIPGHGGLMDRFDCQLLMGTFVNVYISSFIRSPNPHKIVQQILWLSNDEQLAVYNSLREQLIASGLI